MNRNHSSFLGVIFGMVAGAAWGLAFLIPNMLSAFSSLEITLGRYLMYGLYSLLLLFAFGTLWAYIMFRFVSPNVFRDFWLEKSIFG